MKRKYWLIQILLLLMSYSAHCENEHFYYQDYDLISRLYYNQQYSVVKSKLEYLGFTIKEVLPYSIDGKAYEGEFKAIKEYTVPIVVLNIKSLLPSKVEIEFKTTVCKNVRTSYVNFSMVSNHTYSFFFSQIVADCLSRFKSSEFDYMHDYRGIKSINEIKSKSQEVPKLMKRLIFIDTSYVSNNYYSISPSLRVSVFYDVNGDVATFAGQIEKRTLVDRFIKVNVKKKHYMIKHKK